VEEYYTWHPRGEEGGGGRRRRRMVTDSKSNTLEVRE